jgi:hypothetical protein
MIGNNYYYFSACCGNVQSIGISSGETETPWTNFTPTPGNQYAVIINGAFSGCVTYSGVTSTPLEGLTIYNSNPTFILFNDCEICKLTFPCFTPAPVNIPVITGQINECGVITILPMQVECVSSNPSSSQSSDGEVSVSITGGTPPYTVYWSSSTNPSMGIHPALNNLSNGTYAATVVDSYGDFTETVYCKIFTDKDCSFGASITEFPVIECIPNNITGYTFDIT